MTAKSPAPKILVVDDDVRLRDLLTRYLTEQGFQVASLTDASQLDKKLQRDPPHLVVLDLMLPGEDGLAVCRRLRGAGEMVPIIMLTAKGEDVDRIVGLEMGADDYLAKPFNPRELVARIHAVLRRQSERLMPGAPAPPGKIRSGPFLLDPAARTHVVARAMRATILFLRHELRALLERQLNDSKIVQLQALRAALGAADARAQREMLRDIGRQYGVRILSEVERPVVGAPAIGTA